MSKPNYRAWRTRLLVVLAIVSAVAIMLVVRSVLQHIIPWAIAAILIAAVCAMLFRAWKDPR